MICPFRKKTISYPCEVDIPISSNRPNIFKIKQGTIEEEEYLDCYKDDCPCYIPGEKTGDFIISERCLRVIYPKQTKINL